MYARILVPLDGSPLAEGVLPHARHLARAFNAAVDLVCAVEQEDIPEAIVAELEQERRTYIERVVAGFAGDAEPGFVVERGHPAEVILDQAEAKPDTLIVMATHGYSGLQRWFLGSVAHKIVQAASCPVFLFPPYAKNPEGGPVELQRVIVPLDGSDLAEHILPQAIAMCRALDIELILLRVYNPRFPGATVRMREVSEIVHDAAENYVKEKVRELRDQGLSKVSYRVLRGIPAEQITDFAIETPNSFTAMCTHGRHGVGRWVLGSVTDAVIHCSEEPVLVVRAPHPGH
jgi:nucleotide-binding universal stress UspA family protein